jgi:hypothetical protein
MKSAATTVTSRQVPCDVAGTCRLTNRLRTASARAQGMLVHSKKWRGESFNPLKMWPRQHRGSSQYTLYTPLIEAASSPCCRQKCQPVAATSPSIPITPFPR